MTYRIVSKNDLNSKKIKYKLANKIKIPYDNTNPDIVISIGGDGTFLKACHQYPNAIFFAVHTGHLGFYSNYSYYDLDILADSINNNTYNLVNLPAISCKTNSLEEKTYFGINEITVLSSNRTLVFDVFIDDKYFEEFRGTGFCISTPFGSTAYNRSLGGAIIDHNLKCMQITEIASINSNQYKSLNSSLILSSNHKIKLVTKSMYKNIYINADNLSDEHSMLKDIELIYKDNVIKLAYNTNLSFEKRIRKSFIKNK